MANLRLKKMILEVVENQLRDNNPPVVNQVYQELMDAGYSMREAKEKIGAVVLEEIYDVMKENRHYDEKAYAEALEQMVQQCLDFQDTYTIPTEWDEWDNLVELGYEELEKPNYEAIIDYWWSAWEIFKNIVKEQDEKISISRLMEDEDYRYPVDAWLQDFEMELGNAQEHEKRIEFCHAVLEMLDWTCDENSNFISAIGEALYASGKEAEGKAWFEDQLKTNPHNESLLNVFSWCVEEQEGAEKAYQLIKGEVIGVPCTIHNSLLFESAKRLAQELHLENDVKWIGAQLDSFAKSMRKADEYNDLYDDFRMPVQMPVVKEKKIYPNDPCPCGSGKKYKKCCGKN